MRRKVRVKEAPKSFHFLGDLRHSHGISGGSAKERGFKVTGSDENIYPPMSTFLQEKGISFKGVSRRKHPGRRGCRRDRERDDARQSGSGLC